MEYIDQEEEFMVDPETGAGTWVAVRAGSAPISPQQVVQTASIALTSELVHIPSPGTFNLAGSAIPYLAAVGADPNILPHG